MPIADVHVHYFELTPDQFRPKFSAESGLVFSRVEPPMPALNRFLYTAVGAPWFWIERRSWTLEQWTSYLGRGDAVETWILSQDGVPAGYVEFETRPDNAIEIVYIGLLKEFIGDGRGGHLLSKAVERIFARGASKVLLETCNLDHGHAIANYTARGFREVSSVIKQKEIPAEAPGPWENANTADERRALLRHAVAVVAFRANHALANVPGDFAQFRAGDRTRTPIEIVVHLCDLYDWALWMAKSHSVWNNTEPTTWEADVARFFAALAAFDEFLASGATLIWSAERVLAGPIADSLTHIGQIALLRGVSGSPVKGMNYAKADSPLLTGSRVSEGA
jgi:GNAT superfamily N-acetyltransferase